MTKSLGKGLESPNANTQDQQKLSRIELRLSAFEKEVWEAKAAAMGVSVSNLIRNSVDGTTVKRRKRADVDPALLRQLAQIGNNLNQLARWANRDKSKVEAMAVIARLIDIDREVAALRSQIESPANAD